MSRPISRRGAGAAIIALTMAMIAGLVAWTGPTAGALDTPGDSLPPLRIELTADGFDPPTAAAAVGQSIWVDNAAPQPRTVTLDGGALSSGPIPTGGRFVFTLPTGGAFELADDAASPHTATLTVGQPALGGSPTSFASEQFPNLVPPDAPLDLHPDLAISFSRNRILISSVWNATVAQVNAALAANDLVIVGGMNLGFLAPSVLVTEVVGGSAPSDTTQLHTILDDLRSRTTVIRAAALDIEMNVENSLPRPLDADLVEAGDASFGTWQANVNTFGEATGIGENYGLEASRFPQAWNLRDEARRRSPIGPAVDTVVLDIGFDRSHPDLTAATLHRLCTPGETVCTENPINPTSGRPNSKHGNAVAATVGATFDRGLPTSRTSQGLVGGNPEADLHLVPWIAAGAGVQGKSGAVTFWTFTRTFGLILENRPTKFSQLKVLNLSGGTSWNYAAWQNRWSGETCGPGDDDDANPSVQRLACTPNTLDAYLAEFRQVAELARPIAEQMLNIGAVMVIAGGNDSDKFCITRPITTPCAQHERVEAINVDPFAWVDRTWANPSGRGSPILIVEGYGEDKVIGGYSNLGTITAPGSVIGPVVRDDGTMAYEPIRGTSFSAPLVSAAAGFIAALNIAMQGDAIAAHLRARSQGGIAGTLTRRLDVFQSVLALPGMVERLVDVNDATPDGNRRTIRADDGSLLGDDPVRTGTVNGPVWSAPDGNVDLRDFRVFRDAFLFACAEGDISSPSCPPADAVDLDGGPDNPKFDTNLDRCVTGDGLGPCGRPETLYSRLDFNGNGVLDDTRVLVPLTAAGAVAAPGSETLMSDLEVLASRWGFGPGAVTGGYTASELRDLISSADIEIRLDQLWALGVTSAEVDVVSGKDFETRRTIVNRPTSANQLGFHTVTVPVDPVPAAEEPTAVQVRVVATVPGRENPTIYLSPLLDARPGSDLVVKPCSDQLVLIAKPEKPEPGGSSTLTARLVDCLGNGVAGEELQFQVNYAPPGSLLDGEVFIEGTVSPLITATTDSQGRATVEFTYPPKTIDEAQIEVLSYPALQGERLQAVVNIGEEYFKEPGLTVYYNSREVIEEYTRFSTNDWADDDADDCDGPTDSVTSPAGCFASNQRFAFPDFIDEEPGVIMLDRRGFIDLETGVAWDEVRQLGGLEADEYDPAVHYGFIPLVTNVLTWPAGNIAAVTDQQIFSAIDISTDQTVGYQWSGVYPIQIPDVTYTLDANGLRVHGLASINDDTYWQGTTHSTVGAYPGLHPDVPVGHYDREGINHRHQIPTQLGILNRVDGTSFPFASFVDGPLTVRRSANGNFETYVYCGRNDRSLDGGGGYWNNSDPLEAWGRDPDRQRPKREPGDRAAPVHDGVVRGKAMFVAVVSLDGTPPPPNALDLPECDPEGGDASFTVSAAPSEGSVVRFQPATGRVPGDDRLEYEWMFGDGNTSTERSPEHVYDDSGEYIVTLTVTDPEGGIGVSAQQISVANVAPNLWIEATRPTATGIEFDIRVGDIGFVDGLGITIAVTGSSGFPTVPAAPYPIGTHTIAVNNIKSGLYNVTIFAIDKDGGSASRTVQLNVTAPTSFTGTAVAPQAFAGSAPTDADADTLTGTAAAPSPALASFASFASTSDAPSAASFTGATSGVLDSVTIPAFVLSSLDTDTATTLAVRNVSIVNGAPAGAVFDLGDGRTAVPITAGATAQISYLAAGTPTISVTLAGLTVRSPLAVTGAPLVPVVSYLGATSGYVGQEVEVSARVTATSAVGMPVGGRPVTFALPGASVTAVSGTDGVATARLRLPVPAGTPPLTVEVLAASGDAGASATVPFVVLANEPPTVNAGGPYTVAIDGEFSLAATGDDADPGDAATLGYNWDLDGDGDFDDASGPAPVVSVAQLNGLVCGGQCTPGQSRPISVRVTDAKGATATASTTVTTIADFALSVDPGAAVLVPNSQTSFTVTVFSTNGFAQPVTLSAPSLPPGVTATFDPSVVTPNGTSVMTVRVGEFTDGAQSSPLVVRGTAGSLVRETGTSLSLDFGLLPVCSGAVEGMIRNSETGAPASGVSVSITNVGGVVTGPDGRYRIDDLPLSSDNGPRLHELRIAVTATDWESRFIGFFAACNVTRTIDVDLTPKRYGTITGQAFLVDASGANPVPLPSVSVTGVPGMTRGTNAEGRFQFDNVPLGPGNTPRNLTLNIAATTTRHAAIPAPVRVEADAVATAELVAYQICTASARIRVINHATGLPVPGVRINTTGLPFVNVNDQGVGTIPNIPLLGPDNRLRSIGVFVRPLNSTTVYQIVQPNGTLSTTGGVAIPRCGSTTPADLRIVIPPPPQPTTATVVATVTDAETGLPVPGVSVRVTPGNDSPFTDAAGRVSWVVPLGNNVLSVSASAFVRSSTNYYGSAAQSVTLLSNGTHPLEFQVVRRQTSGIEGQVTDAVTGLPIPGVGMSVAGGEAVTGADGRYVLSNLTLGGNNTPSTKTVTAYPNPNLHWSRAQQVTVTAGVNAIADFALVPVCQGASVRGRVINAATGAPLEGALVSTGLQGSTTDAEGRFSLTDLRVGSQNAPLSTTITASKSGFTSASRTVTLFCGADIIIDFGTSDADAATIRGTVTDPGGAPVADVFVGTGFGGSATTNAAGEYSIVGAPVAADGGPRDWQVTFIPPPGSGFDDAVRTATVTAKETTVLDVTLTTSGGGGGENRPPTARITGPGLAPEGSTVTLSAATSSDPDGDETIVLYEWDLGADGIFDASGAGLMTFDVTRPDDGTVAVRLRVTDDKGVTSSTTATVTFTNVAPTVAFADDLVIDEATISRTGSFTDPGIDDTHDATVDWGDGSATETLALDGAAFDLDHTYARSGAYTVAVEVCDDDGGCGQASFDVTITNRPPVANPATVATRTDRQALITLTGSDPDDDELTFAVVSPPANGSLSGDLPDLVYTPDDGFVGDDEFTFTATDGDRTSAPATISIAVTAGNVAPTAVISGPVTAVEGDTVTAVEGDTVTLSAADSFDPDGEIDSYEWDLDDDGTPDGTGSTFDVTLPDDGAVTVRLTVTDDEGASGSTTTSVVFTNAAPTVTLADDLQISADRRMTRTGSFSDPGSADTHTASVDWGEGDGPEPLSLQGSEFELDHTYAEPGDHVVTVEVCDDDGGCGQASFDVTIAPPRVNVPPRAVVTGPSTAIEGSTIDLSAADSEDPDGDIVAMEWDLDDDGSFEHTGSTATVSRRDQGSLTVTLRVTDDDGATDEDRFTVTFTDAAPVVVLRDDLEIDADGRVTRSGYIVDPGLDDRHEVTVDWGDGSDPETVDVADREFLLDHRYGTEQRSVFGLGSVHLVSVTACDLALPDVCATTVFEVSPLQPPPAPAADLGVVLRAPDTASRGTGAVLGITVTNSGPSDATGVELRISLPDGVTSPGVETDSWRCSQSNAQRVVTCSPIAASLPVGAWALALPLAIGQTAPAQLAFAGTIATATTDPVAANNQGAASVAVTAEPSPPPPAPPGPVPTDRLPATGATGIGQQLVLAFMAAMLGLALSITGRRRRRRPLAVPHGR
jgi:PKD repeat protein